MIIFPQRPQTPTPSVRRGSFALAASNISYFFLLNSMITATTTRCQACPQSSQGRLGQASDRPLNPPLVFVIDTTKSVKPDKDSIFNLTGKVTDRIMKDRINIPRYTLVTFNDFGPAINLNVKLEVGFISIVVDPHHIRQFYYDQIEQHTSVDYHVIKNGRSI